MVKLRLVVNFCLQKKLSARLSVIKTRLLKIKKVNKQRPCLQRHSYSVISLTSRDKAIKVHVCKMLADCYKTGLTALSVIIHKATRGKI